MAWGVGDVDFATGAVGVGVRVGVTAGVVDAGTLAEEAEGGLSGDAETMDGAVCGNGDCCPCPCAGGGCAAALMGVGEGIGDGGCCIAACCVCAAPAEPARFCVG